MYNLGDLVRSKAGGPRMVVSAIDPDGVWCQWFEGATRHEAMFTQETLELWSDYEARARRQADDWNANRDDDYDPLGRH